MENANKKNNLDSPQIVTQKVWSSWRVKEETAGTEYRAPNGQTTPVPCFHGETLVYIKDVQGGVDTREIQYIKVGDEVLSRNEVTGEQAYRRVVKTFAHESKAILDVTIDAAGNMAPLPRNQNERFTKEYQAILDWRETIRATPEHPFWVNGVGWVPAGSLQPGQEVEICYDLNTEDINLPVGWARLYEKRLSGGRWTAKVVDVRPEERYRPDVYDLLKVYNLEVEEFHTYFVGGFGVWVHNTCEVFADGATPPIVLEKSTEGNKPVLEQA